MDACITGGPGCQQALQDMTNPFFLEDHAACTQTTGWIDAWTAEVSPYAVAAESAQDVAAAVSFAAAHNLRLVVKGTGHDYFGRSCAADSLLIWTHHMRDVTSHDAFVPQGAPVGTAGVTAVSGQAGARWLEAYTEVTTRHGRYVQGGGCTSVGMAGGFLQGGGFGSFSRRYGTGAANLLEAEIVTADGAVRTVNQYQQPDLFWAIKGGGGGTFGVVTRVTLQTFDAPTESGIIQATIEANDDEALARVLDWFLEFWRDALVSPDWGEKITFTQDRKIDILLLYSGWSEQGVRDLWKPLQMHIASEAGASMRFDVMPLPFQNAWDLEYFERTAPDMVKTDPRTGESAGQFWWAGDQGQVSWYITGYYGRYLPVSLLNNTDRMREVLLEAIKHRDVSVHINKGLAGAAPDAIARSRSTSMNPAVFDAAGLFIIGGGKEAFPNVPGHEPDAGAIRTARKRMRSAYEVIRRATPGAGSYVNESDYHDEDWAAQYWGVHYARLRSIKDRYDPYGLFYGHHLVGSERWRDGGMDPV